MLLKKRFMFDLKERKEVFKYNLYLKKKKKKTSNAVIDFFCHQ
jgi:hypothetical protein